MHGVLLLESGIQGPSHKPGAFEIHLGSNQKRLSDFLPFFCHNACKILRRPP
jgi:hypothetical protein